jgi:hypothetical protein
VHITLQPLSSLHCLSLFVPVIDWDEINPKPLPWLDHLLSTLCVLSPSGTSISNPYLHNLQLIFDIDQLPLFERIEQTEWSSLNGHLKRLLKCRTASSSSSSGLYSSSLSSLEASGAPNLAITIYIFTNLDNIESLEGNGQYMLTCYTFLKDPLGPYVMTSCQCDDKRREETTETVSQDVVNAACQGESGNMRRFLTKFLPVLKSWEGRSIRVLRTNCEFFYWFLCYVWLGWVDVGIY